MTSRWICAIATVICFSTGGFAQQDTLPETQSPQSPDTLSEIPSHHSRDTLPETAAKPQNDTIYVGGMIIVRSGRDRESSSFDTTRGQFTRPRPNVRTNWFVVDLGFNQMNDQTNYAAAIANGYLPEGATEDWFDQQNFKSTNVNIWIFMQHVNLIKHAVNLKYGIGMELNNYKYRRDIRFQENNQPLVVMDEVDYRKNKLAADYLTAPIMLNFNFAPAKKRSIGFSAGISAGYLYSARQKLTAEGLGKKKYREDYDLKKFKISYIGELDLGLIRLYGSYATSSMFEHALDQTPYSFGIRLSKW